MTEPVLVDFNGIAFPSDPHGISALMSALNKVIRAPYFPDKIAPLRGEIVLVSSARVSLSGGGVVGGVVYQTHSVNPPAGTADFSGNTLTSETYTLVTIKHMVVIRR